MSRTPFALIAGAGPGTAASVAKIFAKAYPVVLFARSSTSYEPLVNEINGSGGKAVGFKVDVANADSIQQALVEIEKTFPQQACAAAIFNASGPFKRKPFLETSLEEFRAANEVSLNGAFNFSKAALPLLQKHTDGKFPPTLIFTGATASVISNALMSSFSTGKHALRALAQSLAKEFNPQGIHVAHAIIDGIIDTDKTREMLKDMSADAKIDSSQIAEAYWFLHTQPKSCFTHEIDIRPFGSKW